MTALDCSQLGSRLESLHEYDAADVVRYALAVGAGADELEYLHEAHGPSVLPSYAVIPVFPVVYGLHQALGSNPLGAIHLAQKLQVMRPIPPQGRLRTIGVLDGIYDHGLMASTHVTTETLDDTGALAFRTEWTIAHLLNGGFGGPPPPRRQKVRPPARPADFSYIERISAVQAFQYRLLGDRNPIHTDREIALKSGFPRPILHGLCTYGFVARAVQLACAPAGGVVIEELACEFRKPVFPGETLVTNGWREGSRIVLSASTLERPDEPVMQNAYAQCVSRACVS